MAFWWVSQNRTFEEEHAGGYLWAPNRDKGGKTPHHWRTMGELQIGDSVFCYVDQAIVAIAHVDRATYLASKPFSLVGDDVWQNDGQRADVTYEFLDEPLDIRQVKSERACASALSERWVLDRLQENVERSMQAIEVRDYDGNLTGEYVYQGGVANRALELIGKHRGMFVERREVTGPKGGAIVVRIEREGRRVGK